jgi:hypothetical protein
MLGFFVSAFVVATTVQEEQNQTVSATQSLFSSNSTESPPSPGSSSQVAPIAGGIFALVVFLSLVGGGLYWYCSNRRPQREETIQEELNP